MVKTNDSPVVKAKSLGEKVQEIKGRIKQYAEDNPVAFATSLGIFGGPRIAQMASDAEARRMAMQQEALDIERERVNIQGKEYSLREAISIWERGDFKNEKEKIQFQSGLISAENRLLAKEASGRIALEKNLEFRNTVDFYQIQVMGSRATDMLPNPLDPATALQVRGSSREYWFGLNMNNPKFAKLDNKGKPQTDMAGNYVLDFGKMMPEYIKFEEEELIKARNSNIYSQHYREAQGTPEEKQKVASERTILDLRASRVFLNEKRITAFNNSIDTEIQRLIMGEPPAPPESMGKPKPTIAPKTQLVPTPFSYTAPIPFQKPMGLGGMPEKVFPIIPGFIGYEPSEASKVVRALRDQDIRKAMILALDADWSPEKFRDFLLKKGVDKAYAYDAEAQYEYEQRKARGEVK